MLRLRVTGMTCEHCVTAITRALKRVPAVEDVTVDLLRGSVAVRGNPEIGAVRAAIAEEGYGVEDIA